MTILKHPKGYAVVSTNILLNKELTTTAKYLMCVLLSMPSEWEYDLTELSEMSCVGRDTVRASLETLRRQGYIKIINRHEEDGKDLFDFELFLEPHGEEIEEYVAVQETKPTKKKAPVVKKKYAERVALAEEDYQKLVNLMGKSVADEWIVRLNEYKLSTGKVYASDYHTILAWDRKDRNRRGLSAREKVKEIKTVEVTLDRFAPYWKEALTRRGDMTKFGWSNRAVYEAAKQINWNDDLEFEKTQFYLRLDGLV